MASQPPSNPYQFDSQTPYATAPQAAALVKPKAIKVFGVLNVIFGGLGLLGTCIGLGFILLTSDLIPNNNKTGYECRSCEGEVGQSALECPHCGTTLPALPRKQSLQETMQSNPGFVTQDENAFLYFYNIISNAVALLFAIVLLVSGIGLLKHKKWGRTTGLAWAAYCVLATIVVSVVTWTHIYPYQLETMDEAAAAVPNMETILLVSMIFGNVLSVAYLIYPSLFVIFGSKQSFKDALD